VRLKFLSAAASILNREEWLILAKLVCILIFAFVLVLSSIAWEFPETMFIYGRF
jgi:hypothetical protein